MHGTANFVSGSRLYFKYPVVNRALSSCTSLHNATCKKGQVRKTLLANTFVKPIFSAKNTHDYLNDVRQSLNMSLRFGSVPEIQKGGPCFSHGVHALPNLGLAQRPELEHGKVFVVAIVGGAQMASHVVNLIAQIFEATSLPRFNT